VKNAGSSGNRQSRQSSSTQKAPRHVASSNVDSYSHGETSAYRPISGAPDLTRSEEIIRVRKKKKKPPKAKKIILTVLAFIVGLALVIGIALALYVNSLNNALSFEDSDAEAQLREALTAVESKDSPYYALLLGSDAREGETVSRSDVIILLRVDPSDAVLTMVSIPRDTMVEIPGQGTQKINAAYAFGGAAGAVDAVSNFAGVNIAHYAEINFEEMIELVDMLDGVWVNVPEASDTLAAGEQLLNGEQALSFARDRYSYARGDFQRSDHQRILLEAIMKKILDSSVIELPGLVHKTASCVTTDYDVGDIVDLGLSLQGNSMTIYSCMAPSYSQMIDDISYVITEYEQWNEMMKYVDAGEDPNQGLTNKETGDEGSE